MPSKFIRPKNAAIQCGISLSHMYALIAENNFPKQIKLSGNISVFLEAEIDDWITKQIQRNRTAINTSTKVAGCE